MFYSHDSPLRFLSYVHNNQSHAIFTHAFILHLSRFKSVSIGVDYNSVDFRTESATLPDLVWESQAGTGVVCWQMKISVLVEQNIRFQDITYMTINKYDCKRCTLQLKSLKIKGIFM